MKKILIAMALSVLLTTTGCSAENSTVAVKSEIMTVSEIKSYDLNDFADIELDKYNSIAKSIIKHSGFWKVSAKAMGIGGDDGDSIEDSVRKNLDIIGLGDQHYELMTAYLRTKYTHEQFKEKISIIISQLKLASK